MQIGRNQAGDWVYAYQAKDYKLKDEPVFCPICGQALLIKESKLGKLYFAHRLACQQDGPSQERFSQRQESQSHKAFKESLLDYFGRIGLQVEAEKYLPACQLYADIMVTVKGRQWIIEYQQSPIATQILSKRNQLYLGQGLKVYWLLSDRQVMGRKLGQFHKAMTYYHSSMGYFCLVWQPRSDKLRICYLSSSFYQEWDKEVRVQPCPLIYLLNLPLLMEGQPVNKGRGRARRSGFQSKTRLDHQIRAILKTPSYQKFLKDLYQEGISLWDLPAWTFDLYRECLLLDSPAWLYWAYLLKMIQTSSGTITLKKLEENLKDLIKEGRLILADLPLIEADLVSLLIQDSVKILKDQGLVG